MLTFNKATELINCRIEEEIEKINSFTPRGLYSPISYTLQRGGKRIRPVLTLLSYSLYRTDFEHVFPAAFAIEVFHNFTLLHDDIMDDADIRRGELTVHKKYDENTAILSGDAMSIMAYQYLGATRTENLSQLLQLFNKTALEICDGQQYDMEFETRKDVSVDEYLEMIKLKTAVLLACSMKTGAIVAGASLEDTKLLYNFGLNLGMAFQLQDDLLDVYGDPKVFGKKIGGDIVSNKKTFLLLKALELAPKHQRTELESWINKSSFDRNDKVKAVTEIYNYLKVRELSKEKMEAYYNKAMKSLEDVQVADVQKQELKNLAQKMMNRIS